jgi:SAM-dependent methyltransferase
MRYDMSEIPKEFNPPITNAAYLLRRRLLQAIMRNIHELSGSMMDFGCGSKPYKSLFKVSEYVGVDYQGQGHSHENEIIDVFYDGRHLPFGDNRFDSIFSSEVFEHVFNLEEMVKELHRVLKPGGKMLVTCPFAICEHEAPNDFARYSSYGLKDLLERNGFEVLIFEKSGSAVETICQLYVSYFYAHVVRKLLGKIPVVRSLARVVIVPLLNAISVLLHMLLPAGNDLYMNNIVVVRKK